MRISALCAAVVTCVVVGHPPPAAAQVDQQRAHEFFKDVQAMCEREGKRLWGMSMCGLGHARSREGRAARERWPRWTFKVAAGWMVREGARRGDYEVVRQQP